MSDKTQVDPAEAVARALKTYRGPCGWCDTPQRQEEPADVAAKARRVLDAIRAAGYAIVPLQPTPAMVEDGCVAVGLEEWQVRPIYAAMLAASQPQQQEGR